MGSGKGFCLGFRSASFMSNFDLTALATAAAHALRIGISRVAFIADGD